jgi:co-chaperonin GroES (HSP10)
MKKIIGITPVLSQILVELLTPEEAMNTRLTLGEKTNYGAPQGIVLAVGPTLTPEAGIKKGDRVLLQGTFVPVPNYDNSRRDKGIVEVHNIKGVFQEEEV